MSMANHSISFVRATMACLFLIDFFAGFVALRDDSMGTEAREGIKKVTIQHTALSHS
jgi:hypothetical protein